MNLHFQDTMCANFQLKRTTLTFLAQICPKRNLRFEIQKTNVGIRISMLDIPCVPVFRQNGHLWIFEPKFAVKWILGSKFQKSGYRISTSNIPWVPIFSQIGQILIFWPKFGEIAHNVQYFGPNIVEGDAESWVEAEMNWVEVDGAGWRWMELFGAGWRWMELGGGECTV